MSNEKYLKLKIVNDNLKLLITEVDLNKSINLVLKSIAEFFVADAVHLFLIDEKHNFVNAFWEYCQPQVKSPFNKLQNIPTYFIHSWEKEFLRKSYLFVADVSLILDEHKIERDALISLNVDSFFAFPFYEKEQLRGILTIANLRENSDDFEFLFSLIECLFQKIFKQQKTENFLKLKRDYEQILCEINGGILTIKKQVTGEWIPEYCNDSFLHMISMNRQEFEIFYEKNIIAGIFVEDQYWVEKAINKNLKEKKENFELVYRLLTGKGNIIWVKGNFSYKIDELTNFERLYILYVDVTSKHNIESELEESARRLNLIIDEAMLFIFRKDLNSVYTGGNQLYLEFLGLNSLHELLGKKDASFFCAESEGKLLKTDQDVFLTGRVSKSVEKIRDLAGNTYVLEITKIPYLKKQKIVGLLGMCKDLTKSKRPTDKSSESQLCFNSAIKKSGFINCWEYDLKKNEVLTYSEQSIFNKQKNLTENFPQSFINEKIVFPADKKIYQHNFAKIKSGESNYVIFSVRLLNSKMNFYEWNNFFVSTIYNNNSQREKVVCSTMNVDEQKVSQMFIKKIVGRKFDVVARVELKTENFYLYLTNHGKNANFRQGMNFFERAAEHVQKNQLLENESQILAQLQKEKILRYLESYPEYEILLRVKTKESLIKEKSLTCFYLNDAKQWLCFLLQDLPLVSNKKDKKIINILKLK